MKLTKEEKEVIYRCLVTCGYTGGGWDTKQFEDDYHKEHTRRELEEKFKKEVEK